MELYRSFDYMSVPISLLLIHVFIHSNSLQLSLPVSFLYMTLDSRRRRGRVLYTASIQFIARQHKYYCVD